MKSLCAIYVILLVIRGSFSLIAAPPDASLRIDELIGKKLAESGSALNPRASDEIFLRRIFLDVAGRIPAVEEAEQFLTSTDPEKRSKLIDQLLESEAAVSHDFNYWADILRISELVGNNRLQSYSYSLWLKDALRKNMPYDEFVRRLVSARGFLWENGATGYYHRDRGMPLDNMSNTIRIFLGTRLECAQCHDHPFDQWTQMDYYRMAAFSYTMDARLYAPEGRLAIAKYQNEFLKQAREKAPGGRLERDSADYLRYRGINQVNADMFAFMKFVLTRETPQTLTLPHDYQYSDADPEDPVSPATMFGKDIEAGSVENVVDAYAQWLASAENPRFAVVIANRLWERSMGRGLVPAVDEFMEGSVESASNPDLLKFLTQRMIDLKFDTREFRREIFHSSAYQSRTTEREVDAGVPYDFPGPLLRRLTSEQIWDSLVTLAIPNPDYYMPQLNVRLSQVDRLRRVHESFESIEVDALVELAKKYADLYADSYLEVEELNRKFNEAVAEKDEEKIAELRKKLGRIRGEQTSFVRKKAHGDRVISGRADSLYKNFGIGDPHLPLEKIVKSLPRPASRPGSDAQYSEWRSFSSELMRASELPMPSPRGHFLREFGQSDREGIQNASMSASVPQALTLLNGPFTEALANPNSQLQMAIAAADDHAKKLDKLFLAVLSRQPTQRERELFQAELEEGGEAGIETVLWVLLNSQAFRFLY